MSAYVFVGPTLEREAIEPFHDVVCLPPVAQGDVYQVCQTRPRVIGIIDGYFEGMPSVWHKEILWALSQGVHVYGSASMGALRAAELHVFGMRGVGWVFEQFRDGALEDDDEVAVLHGPAEVEYAPLCEPMVNIRRTLERAAGEDIIEAGLAQDLVRLGKRMFYQDRSWDNLLERATGACFDNGALARLHTWLARGKVDVKREDALAMLSSMQEFLAAGPAPNRPSFDFEWTEMWEEVVLHATARADDPGAMSASDVQVLDELRLSGEAFERATLRAALRHFALKDARQQRLEVDRVELLERINRLRTEQRLFSREALEVFIGQSNIDAGGFERLFEEEVRVDALVEECARRLDIQRLAHLRTSGAYPKLLARARDKQRTLREQGCEDVEPLALGLLPTQLLEWHFDKLARPVPDNIDACVREMGLEGREALYRLLAREYVYCLTKHQHADESQDEH